METRGLNVMQYAVSYPRKKALSENKEIRISYKVYLMKTYHYCFIGYDKGIILMLDVKNRKS